MSMLDKIKGMLKGHEDKSRQGVERGGDFIDEKTQGKYSGQVDTAQQKLNEQLGRDEDRPPT